MTRDEFCDRFVAEMLRIVGPTDGEGNPVEPYARETSGLYYDEDWQRVEGPEACARTDVSYWEAA